MALPHGNWVRKQHWLSYDAELTLIRRYFKSLYDLQPNIEPKCIVPDTMAMLDMLIAGEGVAILPKYLCQEALEKKQVNLLHAFGEFDVFEGSTVENATLEKVTLEAGNYLCFKADGELPQAVIDTWGEIWAYFSDENCKEKRTYKTDYELYLSESEAEIYIGVE